VPPFAIGFVLALLLAFILLAVFMWRAATTRVDERFNRINAPAASLTASATHDRGVRESASQVYQYSVVPGGVRSADDVVAAVRRDPVVAAHYQSVNIRALRVEKLASPKTAYVSYRLGNRIYWTSRPVQLKAGETILTDGTAMIRGRCGNSIAFEQREPRAAASNEPAPEAMDLFIGPDAPADESRPVAWNWDSVNSLAAPAFGPLGTATAPFDALQYAPSVSPWDSPRHDPSLTPFAGGLVGAPLGPGRFGVGGPPPVSLDRITHEGATGKEPGPSNGGSPAPPGEGETHNAENPPGPPGPPGGKGDSPNPHDGPPSVFDGPPPGFDGPPSGFNPPSFVTPPLDNTAVVPEPGTLILVGSGVAAAVLRRRSRNSKSR
jgi:hypothetical protein